MNYTDPLPDRLSDLIKLALNDLEKENSATLAPVDRDMVALLHATTSGAVWAAEFLRVAKDLGYSDMDEGWLIGWFANAIECGRNHGQQAEREKAEADAAIAHQDTLRLLDRMQAQAVKDGNEIATLRAEKATLEAKLAKAMEVVNLARKATHMGVARDADLLALMDAVADFDALKSLGESRG